MCDGYVLVCGGGVFDGVEFDANSQMVIVKGSVMVYVGVRRELNEEELLFKYIDLGDAIVMPGLIDCHMHASIWRDDYQINHLCNSSGYKALHVMKRLKECLYYGWTTVRSAGDADTYYPTFDVRRALKTLYNNEGPTICGAGHYISISGGGGDMNQIGSDKCSRCPSDGLIADGIEEVRKAVRTEIKYGADWIKIMVTGSFMGCNDHPTQTHMADDEISMAVNTAAQFGIPVMAHAHGADGCVAALRNGVRSIEHGSFIDDKGIDLMLERGAYLVPTLYIGEHYKSVGSPSGALDKMIALEHELDELAWSRLRHAVERGVNVALGTDYVGWDPKLNYKEAVCMNEILGMSVVAVLRSATSAASTLLQKHHEIGFIKCGFRADIVAVPSSVVDDINKLEQLFFVMYGGKVVRIDPQTQKVVI